MSQVVVYDRTRTKIVATLGPASWDEPMLTALMEAGADVFRINCSHSKADDIRRQVSRIRRVAMSLDRPTAILLDLQGPKIRTGNVSDPLLLEAGDTLTIVMDSDLVGRGKQIGTTYTKLAEDVSKGTRILFDDGSLSGEVSECRLGSDPPEIDVEIINGGALKSHKGINIPEVPLSAPSLSPKDLNDLEVGLDVGVDFVALSFVRSAEDVLDLKAHIDRLGSPTPIIAKIEKPQAIENLDAILKVCDGVMVARGDLGVEVPIEKLPVYQKNIIEAAHRAGVLCITATQMLDSMERNPTPTRAETTDVANAILDGTDAVMLSGETAVGQFPVEAVTMMDRIAHEVESSRFFKPRDLDTLPPMPGAAGIVAKAACFATLEMTPPIMVFTWSGNTALFVSKARPQGPIFALTPQPRVADQLSLAWGVTPIVIPHIESADELISVGERTLLERGWIRPGEQVVILAGSSPKQGATNLMKLHQAGASD